MEENNPNMNNYKHITTQKHLCPFTWESIRILSCSYIRTSLENDVTLALLKRNHNAVSLTSRIFVCPHDTKCYSSIIKA